MTGPMIDREKGKKYEGRSFGSWIRKDDISEDRMVESIAETTKRLLEHMHKCVEPENDIELIFKLVPAGVEDNFTVIGAWKCYGVPKGTEGKTIDRERVIQDLISSGAMSNASKCPFVALMPKTVDDAIAMLKEQETKDTGKRRIFECEKCGYGIDDIFLAEEEKYPIDPIYCPNCGRKVKLE